MHVLRRPVVYSRLFLAFLLLAVPLAARQDYAQTSHPQELRGLWVVRTSITSPEQIHQVIQTAKSHRFNALFVQVRGRGDAFYHSSLEPRAEELSKQSADFDPLTQIIQQGHAAGLQIHAWMNTCYVWGSTKRPLAANHVVNAHPDWLARDAKNHYLISQGAQCEGAFMTPANLAARQHIHDVFLDVARNYDIDGIHFDYVRYPNSQYDYSEAALFRFKTQKESSLTAAQIASFARRGDRDRLIYVHAFPKEWQEFRRSQITELVANISQDVKTLKPWVIVSAAVFADSVDARTKRGQDWKTWLQRGYLDAVVPMAYGASTPQVAAQVRDAESCAHSAGRLAYAGIGAWHISPDSTIAKIGVSRSLGAQGIVLFSYGGVTKDGTSIAYLDKVAGQCFHDEADVPTMAWLKPRQTAADKDPSAAVSLDHTAP